MPRFIPAQDLDRLMPAIDAIACPFQRAALLVARWSGARTPRSSACRWTAWAAIPTAPRGGR
ncbi:hypothetical protein OG372_34645 [Streptomyces sp. NBC_01020]|uniref:hypothetical protein n=1 Tax=unclassified Streptomyces TaxID=2593676 RepID=UPI002E1B9202|nr:hypothetical protein OG372_34645 [Streptomyces sp. NBC_01020]